MTQYEALREDLKRRPRSWLVTGAAGFIGSHLVETLLGLHQNVVGVDNFSTGSRRNLLEVKDALGEREWRRLRFIEGDIRSLDTCNAACQGADFVLHQAALGSVPRSIEDPLATHESNVTGFFNMLLAARDAGVARFVYAGSSAVYGDDDVLPRVETRIGRALSPYATSKYIDELYALVFERCYGLSSIGLRYFNVFGERQDADHPYAAVIPQWIASMMRGEPVFINGDGGITRDFCYVANAVQANLLAATTEESSAVNEVYNVALNETTTLDELFGMLQALLVPHFPNLARARPVVRDFRPGDVRASRADIGKAQRRLGYQPLWQVRQGLERTLGWYRTKLATPAEAAVAEAG